jgi:hypothetical protein
MIENPFFNNEAGYDPNTDPREEILTIWDFSIEDIPEYGIENLQQQRGNQKEVEYLISQRKLAWLLHQYGVKGLEIEQREDGSVAIPVKEHFMSDRLPEGYGYKGGAARALLLRNLGIDPDAKPRDIDLIRLVDTEPERGLDAAMARKYMPEDYEQDHGVELLRSNYFNTRDFTINEVYATDYEVIATRACLLDTIRHILRVTDYEKEIFGKIGPKMMTKLLRFYCESIIKFEQTDFGENEKEAIKELYDYPNISSFWIALQLDKAYEISKDVAEKFVQECIKIGLLPNDIRSAADAADYLLEDIYDFGFRHAPVGQWRMEELWLEEEKWEHTEPFEQEDRRRKKRDNF